MQTAHSLGEQGHTAAVCVQTFIHSGTHPTAAPCPGSACNPPGPAATNTPLPGCRPRARQPLGRTLNSTGRPASMHVDDFEKSAATPPAQGSASLVTLSPAAPGSAPGALGGGRPTGGHAIRQAAAGKHEQSVTQLLARPLMPTSARVLSGSVVSLLALLVKPCAHSCCLIPGRTLHGSHLSHSLLQEGTPDRHRLVQDLLSLLQDPPRQSSRRCLLPSCRAALLYSHTWRPTRK